MCFKMYQGMFLTQENCVPFIVGTKIALLFSLILIPLFSCQQRLKTLPDNDAPIALICLELIKPPCNESGCSEVS